MKLSTLNISPYNPRKMSVEDMGRLKQSIMDYTPTRLGWEEGDGYRLASSVTVNKQGNRIVGGHQRVSALRLLDQGWIHDDDITWVDVLPDSSTEKALNIALNSPDAQGDFDWDKVKTLMDEMSLDDFNLEMTAFAPERLEEISDYKIVDLSTQILDEDPPVPAIGQDDLVLRFDGAESDVIRQATVKMGEQIGDQIECSSLCLELARQFLDS